MLTDDWGEGQVLAGFDGINDMYITLRLSFLFFPFLRCWADGGKGLVTMYYGITGLARVSVLSLVGSASLLHVVSTRDRDYHGRVGQS